MNLVIITIFLITHTIQIVLITNFPKTTKEMVK